MKVVFSNADQPNDGVAAIPFPIPKEEYDNCITILNALNIGSRFLADCKVAEISDDSPIFKRLVDGSINVDEFDYLIKRMDSFDKRELAQFNALAISQNIHEIKDLINLTFCCQGIPLVQDFIDLEKTGRFWYMERNSGMLCSGDENIDFKREALKLLLNEDGNVTQYGVIYDKGFQLAQIYDGQHFPQYRYEDCVMSVEVFDSNCSYEEQTSVFLDLPISELRLQRILTLSGLGDKELAISIIDTALPHEAIPIIDFEGESITDVNVFCEEISGMSKDDISKMDAVIQFAKPNNAKELTNLVQQLDLFDFVPNISTAKEYGRQWQPQGNF